MNLNFIFIINYIQKRMFVNGYFCIQRSVRQEPLLVLVSGEDRLYQNKGLQSERRAFSLKKAMCPYEMHIEF